MTSSPGTILSHNFFRSNSDLDRHSFHPPMVATSAGLAPLRRSGLTLLLSRVGSMRLWFFIFSRIFGQVSDAVLSQTIQEATLHEEDQVLCAEQSIQHLGSISSNNEAGDRTSNRSRGHTQGQAHHGQPDKGRRRTNSNLLGNRLRPSGNYCRQPHSRRDRLEHVRA